MIRHVSSLTPSSTTSVTAARQLEELSAEKRDASRRVAELESALVRERQEGEAREREMRAQADVLTQQVRGREAGRWESGMC